MLFSDLSSDSNIGLCGFALWLFFSVFLPIMATMLADAIYPLTKNASTLVQLKNIRITQGLSRLSPSTLYKEAAITLLSPNVRTLGPILMEQTYGSIPGFLPFGQSLLLIWPHLTGLAAGTLIIFGIAYTLFSRQEVRA